MVVAGNYLHCGSFVADNMHTTRLLQGSIGHRMLIAAAAAATVIVVVVVVVVVVGCVG